MHFMISFNVPFFRQFFHVKALSSHSLLSQFIVCQAISVHDFGKFKKQENEVLENVNEERRPRVAEEFPLPVESFPVTSLLPPIFANALNYQYVVSNTTMKFLDRRGKARRCIRIG